MPRLAAVMLPLYALTLFVSACLLFLVQPLLGKLIVPLLGGSPAVWNTCLVFFQAALLAGYAYAHLSTRWLGERKQAVVHLAVLLLPFLVLPLHVLPDLVRSSGDNPVLGLLWLLLVVAGLPFFAVSTTAPLLQRWFAGTAHPAARDPYFLYAASNVGSLLALFSYPVLLEPYWRLPEQAWWWTIGYGLLALLVAGCAVLLWVAPRSAPAGPSDDKLGTELRRLADDNVPGAGAESVSPWRILHWLALAFVPSSLLMGVTTYITTDIAAVPLLWILPLGLYLLSFVIVFSAYPWWLRVLLGLTTPMVMLLLAFVMISDIPLARSVVIVLHLTVLFLVALLCHGELARLRPAPQYLTGFYLWLSAGGVLGGLFNALAAPLLFPTLIEYPVALVLAGLLLPPLTAPRPWSSQRLIFDLCWVLLVATLASEFYGGFRLTGRLLGDAVATIRVEVDAAARRLGTDPDKFRLLLTYAPPLLVCYLLIERPWRFGLGLGAALVAAALPTAFDPTVVHRSRSFFGTVRVVESGSFRKLVHGTTVHGMQRRLTATDDGEAIDPDREPLTYYHRDGPIGEVFAAFSGEAAKRDLAVVGLGTGTLAAYPERGHRLTFYEIDRKVKELSFDRDDYFTYVRAAQKRGVDVRIELGDARLQLDRPGEAYDLIIVDAFNSDAIPWHLITQEAMDVYLRRLKSNGLIAFHTSNRYLTLSPVVVNVALSRGLVALVRGDPEEDYASGKFPSSWVLVGRSVDDFGKLAENPRWVRGDLRPELGIWSDDYTNLLSVFDWRNN